MGGGWGLISKGSQGFPLTFFFNRPPGESTPSVGKSCPCYWNSSKAVQCAQSAGIMHNVRQFFTLYMYMNVYCIEV